MALQWGVIALANLVRSVRYQDSVPAEYFSIQCSEQSEIGMSLAVDGGITLLQSIWCDL